MSRGTRVYEALELWGDRPQRDVQAHVQGRSQELLAKRDERLCARLYWYKRKTLWEYDYVIDALEAEFELAGATIRKIVQEDSSAVWLKRLMQSGPATEYFLMRWPGMDWVSMPPTMAERLAQREATDELPQKA